jgi:hypothetical protein
MMSIGKRPTSACPRLRKTFNEESAMKAVVMVTTLSMWLLIRAVGPIAGDCTCAVVNKAQVVTAGGTCDAGGGNTGPCISMGTPTYQQGGLPQDGVCQSAPDCTGTGMCTYKTIRVSITIAPCASACGVANPVPWKQDPPPAWGTPSTGSQATNSFVTYDVGAGSVPNLCGTAEVTVPFQFYKKDGTTAFKAEFTFGCGACPKIII